MDNENTVNFAQPDGTIPGQSFEELMKQLDDIHTKLKEQIKGKTGTPAIKHQMAMVSNLLSSIKATPAQPAAPALFGALADAMKTVDSCDEMWKIWKTCQELVEDKLEDETLTPDQKKVAVSGILAELPATLMAGIFETLSADKSEVINFTADDMPGNVIEFASDVGPGESIIKSARIFYTGTHKGRKYTKADLKKIVNNFNPAENIPLQLDHSKSARDTIGYPRTMTLTPDGTEIYSDIEILGKDNVEKVRLGLWKKLSSGLSIRLPEMKADHVAVTPFPALEQATMFSKTETEQFEINSKNKEGGTTMEDNAKQIQMTADFESMKIEFAKMEQEKKVLEEKFQFKEDQEYIETFTMGENIKTTPAMKPLELKLYHSLNDEQRVMFNEMKAVQPTFIDLNIYSTQKALKPGEKSAEEIDKQAEAILQFAK